MSRITVFIDEGGDSGVKDGLRYHGSRYEWLTLSAYIIRTCDAEKPAAIRDKILEECRLRQVQTVHYYKMKEDRRLQACKILSEHSARAIVFASHKSNMREHVNAVMGKPNSQNFYNFCTKLLLERVNEFALNDAKANGYAPEPLQIVLSRIDTHDYNAMFSYFERMNEQALKGGGKLTPKAWSPDLMVRDYWRSEPHAAIAGLQLADLVASAFLQGANARAANFNTAMAESLKPIIAKDAKGMRRNAGVTLWPLSYQAPIPEESRPLFQFYGYEFDGRPRMSFRD